MIERQAGPVAGPIVGPVAVIGANGRSGEALCRALLHEGHDVLALLRSPEKLAPDLTRATVRIAELTDHGSLSAALKGASVVVNTAHARHLPAILAATRAPVTALGSTRKFTRWPDDHGRGVIAGETALQRDGRPSLILHPTMIYGAQGEDNVQRLARLLDRLPVVPLPEGGRSLVQPIDQRDVTRCLVKSVELLAASRLNGPESLVIAGPDAVPYRDFVQMILYFSGRSARPVIRLPARLLIAVSRLTGILPGLPAIGPEEVRRLMEDKNFDIAPMRQRLGVEPLKLETGLYHLLKAGRETGRAA